MKPHILYEDQDIIVCLKPAGIPTQTSRPGLPDMVSILKNHIYQNSAHKKQPYLAVIHRLDQPVEGLLVFAKTPAAAKELNRQLQSFGFGKYYQAVLLGCPQTADGILEDYLVKDGRTNTSRICTEETPGAKSCTPFLPYCKNNSGIFTGRDSSGYRTLSPDPGTNGSPWLSHRRRPKI